MEAYPVPFDLDRTRPATLVLRNASAETLRWVRVEMLGPGLASAPLTPRLDPGDHIEVKVRGDDLGTSSRVIVRWLRPSGGEYLWGIAL